MLTGEFFWWGCGEAFWDDRVVLGGRQRGCSALMVWEICSRFPVVGSFLGWGMRLVESLGMGVDGGLGGGEGGRGAGRLQVGRPVGL
jgi:hypothetical protein